MYATKGEKRNGSFQIDGFTLGELLIVILIISGSSNIEMGKKKV